MAFNLNKNEETDTSKRTGFDLSKNTPEPGAQAQKPNYWPYLIAALLVIGVATWYLNRGDTAIERSTNDPNLESATAKTNTSTEKNEADDHKPALTIANDGQTAQETPATETTNPIDPVPLVAASFPAGSSKPTGLSNAILKTIRKKQASGHGIAISVLGYASSEGDPAVNQAISQDRADAYKQFLVQNGFAEHTITATGKGTKNPIASNETEAGRRKNRRVEVLFNEQH